MAAACTLGGRPLVESWVALEAAAKAVGADVDEHDVRPVRSALVVRSQIAGRCHPGGPGTALISRIDADSLKPFRFQRWTGKRLTRSYRWNYDFENRPFAPTVPISTSSVQLAPPI